MNDCYNHVTLCGQVISPPELSHTNHGESFFRFLLSIPRLSGQCDELPILARHSLLPEALEVGDTVSLTGQLRSFNNRSGQGRRLILSVFAQRITKAPGQEPENRICLCGAVCKAPTLRSTPLGREICDVLLAVNRRCGRSDYLPVITWGMLARQAAELSTGDLFCAEGRVQSRTYLKMLDGESKLRTAYEVSVMHMARREEFEEE